MQKRVESRYRLIALAAAVAAMAATSVRARAAQVECDSLAPFVKTVSLGGAFLPTYSTFNFPDDGVGHFDTLLSTRLLVGGTGRSCLVATFSTQAYPLDNSILFQVRVDGVPMNGHMAGAGGVASPVVFDPEETDLNLPRMVSYTFSQPIAPGIHTVDVRFAGCCSGAPVPGEVAAYAGSPTLTLWHR
ncbi:MAG: hypothetical protein ACHQKZ_06030 [Solirubrobacterales bacterium]|jgi:hypothetical protein